MTTVNVTDLFDPNACDIRGKASKDVRSWSEYFDYKKQLESDGTQVVLVDMINHPVEGAVPISNELFDGRYPDGTYFALYCHSGGSSGYVQMQLKPQLPQYHFINIAGGIGMYGLR